MIEKLKSFYKDRGISAVDFSCPNEESCRSVCEDFITAREAYVGPRYIKGDLPRLLFVSLDASGEHPGRRPEQRTIEYQLELAEKEGYNPPKKAERQHWYLTHEFAHRLLNHCATDKDDPPNSIAAAHDCFAHTNSAKCKDTARGSSQGHKLLFENCRPFIGPEVELLAPDVLATQGDKAHSAIDGFFQTIHEFSHPSNQRYSFTIREMSGRPFLHYRLYHPAARGNKYGIQKDQVFPWYFDVAKAFLQGGVDAAKAVKYRF